MAGAPPKYKEEIVDWLLEYVHSFDPYEVIHHKSWDRDGNEIVTEKYYASKLPSIVDFCHKWLPEKKDFRIHRSTFFEEWLNKYPELSDSYKEFLDIRKDLMIRQGNMGLVPSSTYIFNAVNLTDMTNKKEIDQTTKHSGSVGIGDVPSDDDFMEFVKQKSKKNV